MRMSLDDLRSAMTQLDGLYLLGQQADAATDPAKSFDLIESAPSRGGDNPFELCMEGERRAQLSEAISRMPEREQLILSLYYIEELTMKEIAEVVGIGVSRVSQIHAAAMVTLRASLSHFSEDTAASTNYQHATNQGADRQRLRK
jgi:RNA polymerase sigma factor for flagellar operon FliA